MKKELLWCGEEVVECVDKKVKLAGARENGLCCNDTGEKVRE